MGNVGRKKGFRQMIKSGTLKRLACLGVVFGCMVGRDTVAQGGELVPGQWSMEKA